MRNNEERFQAHSADSTPPPVEEAKPLHFITPTDFVELPSRGRYYSKDHPLCDHEHLEIRQMTAKDEDILTSAALLKKGIAVERLVEKLIVDKNLNVEELLVGDKSAILITARISAYGPMYETKVQCPFCDHYSDYEFDLREVKINHGKEPSDLSEVVLTKDKTFIITLPNSTAKVETRLLTGMDEKKFIYSMQQHKKHNLELATVTDQMKTFIISVNDVTDSTQVSNFIDNMPAKDSRHLRNTYSQLAPNIDLTQYFACMYCNSETKMEVPLTADFFWPK
jgi:transcription elongation factor Elf1